MKSWVRAASVHTWCGYCGAQVPVGDPVLEIGVNRLRRCRDCAGESVPVDIPVIPEPWRRIERTAKPGEFAHISASAAATVHNFADWKLKQSGDHD